MKQALSPPQWRSAQQLSFGLSWQSLEFGGVQERWVVGLWADFLSAGMLASSEIFEVEISFLLLCLEVGGQTRRDR